VEHTSALDVVHNLSNLCLKQGKRAEAEQMYVWALREYEKGWGAEHTSTLGTVNHLGLLYARQGKMAEVEQVYGRATRRPLASSHYCGWLVAEGMVHFRWI